MNRRGKLTPEQSHHLVQVYLHMGRDASAVLCVEYGVSPKYASSAAAALGLLRPKWRAGNRYRDNHVDNSVRSKNDPRWARAIERGNIIA